MSLAIAECFDQFDEFGQSRICLEAQSNDRVLPDNFGVNPDNQLDSRQQSVALPLDAADCGDWHLDFLYPGGLHYSTDSAEIYQQIMAERARFAIVKQE